MKLNFNNSHAVYMHDTPSQSLFGRNFRAASSGCVRVHGIEQLAAWVLADQGWKEEHIKHIKQTGERRDIRLKQPMPLYFTYLTAWATPDGVVQFRRDLYQKDGVGPGAGASERAGGRAGPEKASMRQSAVARSIPPRLE